MKRIPIAIIIDVEPDERETDLSAPRDWEGFEKTSEFFKKLRPQLENATQEAANFSWFFRMDPQIAKTYGTPEWVAKRYPELIEEFTAAGDELGLHPHAWRWDEASSDWIADLGNQEWVNHCIRMGFEAFEKSFKRPCRSFRFGNHWMNDVTLELVERLGARFELTVEPGQKKFFVLDRYTGSLPDYLNVPRRPYRPSKRDFRQRDLWGGRKLWMIPQSTGHIDWQLPSSNGDRTTTDSNGGNLHSSLKQNGSDASAQAALTPVYEGYLDRIDCRTIWGWAYDANRPNDALDVELYDGDRLLATIPAYTFRPDLALAGKGDGRHAFCIHVPGRLKDAKPHSIRVKIAGSDFELSNSPLEINCRKADWDDEFLLLLNTNPWVMRRSVDTLLDNLKTPYLALPVRTDVGSNPFELANMEQNFNYLLSHPLVKRFVFTTPAELVKRVG
jgi:hypothetical protein